MDIRILGPLEVTDGARLLELGGFRQRLLLARLALAANQVVSVEALVDELWGTAPPAGAKQALQAHASRIRRGLGDAARLVARGRGYVLRLQPEELDAGRFEALLTGARAAAANGDFDVATKLWTDADYLWRGPALAEFVDYAFAQAEAARLEELRLDAIEAHMEVELTLGRHREVVAELDRLVGAHPYRERLWAHLMLALYRAGRQADALGAYQRLRTILGEELGITPSPELVRLEESILLQMPELAAVSLLAPRPARNSSAGDRRAKPPDNLPRPRSSFVGRQRELEELERLLQVPGLVTIVGPGGVGKTRLAIEAGRRRLNTSSGGAWIVELAALADGALIPETVAAAVGVGEERSEPVLNALAAIFADHSALVVLDNCEHLVNAVALFVEALLAGCPALTVLATSREPLGVEGEVLWRTPTLEVPPQHVAAPDTARNFEAVQLFCERAAVHGGFNLQEENSAAVVELCRRLDGIPLALELAAVRATVLTPMELVARLNDRFALLSKGRRTAPARHQTMNAAIDWSYDLLAAEEQTLFRRLSVFAGSFTLAATESVCQGRGLGAELLDGVTSLANKSFLLADTDWQPTRFRLLETLREYARGALASSGELEPVQERLLEWELALAKAAEEQLAGPGQNEWMSQIAAEIDNIRSTLDWASTAGRGADALELVLSLLRYWEVHGVKEGRGRIEQFLAVGSPPLPADLRVRALVALGVLAAHQGDHERVRSVYEEGLDAARQLSDDSGVERALLGLGHLAYMQGDYGPSRRFCTESLELARNLGDLRGEAASLHVLGRIAHFQSRDADAAAALEASLAVRERMGDQDWIAVALGALADLAFRQENLDLAWAYCRKGLEAADAARSAHQRAWSTNLLGALELAAGRLEAARVALTDSLDAFRELGDRSCTTRGLLRLSELNRAAGDDGAALLLAREALDCAAQNGEKLSAIESLEQIAAMLTRTGELADAVALFACTDRLRTELEAPLTARRRAGRERDLTTAQQALGNAYGATWETGRDMSLDDAQRFAVKTTNLASAATT